MQEQRNSSALAMELPIDFIAMRSPANHTGDNIEKMLRINAKDIKFDN